MLLLYNRWPHLTKKRKTIKTEKSTEAPRSAAGDSHPSDLRSAEATANNNNRKNKIGLNEAVGVCGAFAYQRALISIELAATSCFSAVPPRMQLSCWALQRGAEERRAQLTLKRFEVPHYRLVLQLRDMAAIVTIIDVIYSDSLHFHTVIRSAQFGDALHCARYILDFLECFFFKGM